MAKFVGNINNNGDRGERALCCLESEYNDGGEDTQTHMYDLICDLHHLADSEGIDWDNILRMADMHYQAEIDEQQE